VSYISGEFGDTGNWSSNFHVDTTGAGGELDLSTGEWCALVYTAPAIVSRVLGATTDSTGGYQIKDMLDVSHSMEFAKTGFFNGLATATVECGKETQLNYELICSNPLTTVVTDTDNSRIPGATVEATVTFAVNYGTGTDTKKDSGVTNNDGVATFNIAGAGAIVGTASAPGHDFISCTVTTSNADCDQTPDMKCGLCKWNTIVGTVKIGTQWAEGYTVKALNMKTLEFVDADVTTAAGVFAVENLSFGLGPTYRIYIYSPSDTLIFTSPDITLTADDCGKTGLATYDDGTWNLTGF